MIGFVVLGIVMLLWVLTWDSADGSDLGPQRPSGPETGA